VIWIKRYVQQRNSQSKFMIKSHPIYIVVIIDRKNQDLSQIEGRFTLSRTFFMLFIMFCVIFQSRQESNNN